MLPLDGAGWEGFEAILEQAASEPPMEIIPFPSKPPQRPSTGTVIPLDPKDFNV